MKYLLYIIILSTSMSAQTIFNFSKDCNIQGWRIVDDVVMGGRSSSSFTLNPEGFGTFSGMVSLENKGGFSSVRYQFKKMNASQDSNIIIRLKGDGKTYQFRIKNSPRNYYSYIASFSTSGEWQEIAIPLRDMYPSFRGRKLDQSNFAHDYIEEITFLIGNKKNETFKLLIDTITLK